MPVNILECRRFSETYNLSKRVRVVKDYELDLELGNERTVVIDDEQFLIRPGNICIRKPGQTIYGISKQRRITQDTILLTVDFSGEQLFEHYSRNIEGPLQREWESPLIDNLTTVIAPHSEHTFQPIYYELLSLPLSDMNAETLVMELLYRLNAEMCRNKYTLNKPPETPSSVVMNYMKNHFDQEISLESLAQMVHLDKSYLVRVFRETYGAPPIETLIDLRMDHACDLISNTDTPISNVASACGYKSPSYFITEYKKRFGITPAAQRQKNAGQ